MPSAINRNSSADDADYAEEIVKQKSKLETRNQKPETYLPPCARIALPGLTPDCIAESFTTNTPPTRTWTIPSEYFAGSSNVDLSMTVAGLNTVRSASAPT